jgi:hypothetical protein
MRIERKQNRLLVPALCFQLGAKQNLAMTSMNAIEISEANDGRVRGIE